MRGATKASGAIATSLLPKAHHEPKPFRSAQRFLDQVATGARHVNEFQARGNRPGTALYYQSQRGFGGTDYVEAEVIFPSGNLRLDPDPHPVTTTAAAIPAVRPSAPPCSGAAGRHPGPQDRYCTVRPVDGSPTGIDDIARILLVHPHNLFFNSL